MGIRNSAKAVIIQNDRLLAIKKEDKDGHYYILPGGGQDHGENLHQALKRECMEEVNAEVEVGDVIFIREYIGKNHEHFEFDSTVHQTEYMFLCEINGKSERIGNGSVPDDGQIGVEWLSIAELLNYRLYPQTMRQYIVDYVEGKELPVYLGDIN
ncbi:NUDIX domain-containing protein [Gracilibacillus oryzae]|uniref:NUDIX domain-containing protein n=1 Tax=Gracilibacillus oryzae TaxID=1672701 RepID=A0A7C8KRP4_9BACI|nr:NUDIX domain-containing protein [Gracilibacillus oryzae]KAB8126643.1 NUDIX domain-containing protein [Gracilibacillus oryzae]